MAASLAGVLMGADVAAMPVAASSKGVDAGKFAVSFSAQIVSTGSMEISAASDKTETGQQTRANGIAEKVNADNDVNAADALTALMAPSAAGQAVALPILSGVISLGVKTEMTTATKQGTATPQAGQGRSIETPGSVAANVVATGVALDGSSSSLNDLETGVTTDPQEMVPVVTSEQATEAAPHEDAPVQGGLPQQGALGEVAIPVKMTGGAMCQTPGLQSEQKVSFGKLNVPVTSVDDAAPVKKFAKKQEGSKDALPVKGADVPKSSAGVDGRSGFASVPASGQVVVTAASCVVAAQNVSDSKPQIVSQPVVKSATAHVVVAAKQDVRGASAGRDQGDGKQAVVAGKIVVEGAAPKPSPSGEVSALQKSDPAVKASTSMASSVGTLVAKPQVANSPDRLSTGASSAVANATAVSAGIHAGTVVSQKNAVADVPASAVMAHAGNGESSGVAMQAMDGGHRTLAATPTVLEVGIPNGTQGWLKVRAELAGGGVNASVSAASSAGQEMLHRELPAMTAYLQQEKVAVNSLVVHTPAGGMLRSLSGGPSSGSGGQMQGQDQGRSGRQAVVMANESFFDGHVSDVDDVLTTTQNLRGGGWLSVRA